MKSVIAIVGRPNVGKSTLFNRLVGSRKALVADQPGVTRDRLYGTASCNGRNCILIDTGGLYEAEHAGKSELEKLVTRQALQAAREADAVIWLVDGRAGLTVQDEKLASLLRKHCKRIYLAVNKTEGLDPALTLAEFHALGCHGPFAVSAQRGSGVAALMDSVVAGLPPAESAPVEFAAGLRITVLGRPNVGKSTLVNRMLGAERMITYDKPGTTRDSVAVPFDRQGRHYTLIDTAGVRRRARVTSAIESISVVKALQAIDESEIVILVVDAQEDVTDQDASLLGLAVENGRALIIAVNKWDDLGREQRDRIRVQLERRFQFADYAVIHYISALHGTGVGKLFESIDRIGRSLSVTASASRLTEILQRAVAQHAPPLVRGRRIKLRYAHIGGHNPLRVIVHGTQVRAVPDAYRRYLAHAYQRALRLTGTPVFIEFRQGENPYKKK